ncbi:hypothetical protein ACSBR1_029569 [Camellia fascicularis]
MSFDQLKWYNNAVMENNPHSYMNLDFDQQTGRFVRYFISFHACIDGFNHCRSLLFLNGTFLKGKFKGNLLAATAKDGNEGLFPVAFAIVDSENALVAFRNSGKNLYESIELAYHVNECRATYDGRVHPIPMVAKPKFTTTDYLIAPPVVKQPPGRPQKKRIPSKGEVVLRIRYNSHPFFGLRLQRCGQVYGISSC